MARRNSEDPVFVYADDSALQIEGKAHCVVGAIIPYRPEQTALAMVQLKRELGLSAFDEAKWNRSGLSKEQRDRLSGGIANILSANVTGLISVLEGTDKQSAAEMLVSQLFDFCNKRRSPAFMLYTDENLVPNLCDLRKYVLQRSGRVMCLGVESICSSHDQLIQCADVFIGLLRLEILHELRGHSVSITVDDIYEEESVELTLSQYIHVCLRQVLWGRHKPGSPDVKEAMGLGFRIESSISQRTKRVLKMGVATSYVGCMH